MIKDYDAIMTSVEHLQASFPLWGWPAADLSLEQDLIDLAWRQREAMLRSSFNYAVMSRDERRLLGCVYIDPPEKTGSDAEVSFWVRADELATGLEAELKTAVRRWVAERWPFTTVCYPGRDISWDDWDALPDHVPQLTGLATTPCPRQPKIGPIRGSRAMRLARRSARRGGGASGWPTAKRVSSSSGLPQASTGS